MSDEALKKLDPAAMRALQHHISDKIFAACGDRLRFTLFIWSDDQTSVKGGQKALAYAHVTNMPFDISAQALRQAADNFEQKSKMLMTSAPGQQKPVRQ